MWIFFRKNERKQEKNMINEKKGVPSADQREIGQRATH
jgi:hypothetical protein